MQCPGNGETFAYSYTFCASSTNIGQVIGNCTADGDKIEEIESTPCSEWADLGTFLVYCHECEGGNRAVCSDSTDTAQVCTDVEANTCSATSGVAYEVDRFPCVNDNDYKYTIVTCQDGNQISNEVGTFDCRAFGLGANCYNCDGLELCASVDGTCAEVLGTSTSTSEGNAVSTLLVPFAGLWMAVLARGMT